MIRFLKKYWAVFLIIIFYFVLLIFYFINFQYGLSSKNDDWGTFGDFLGGTLSPIVGVISIILTFNIINYQIKENRQTEFKTIFKFLFDSISEKEKIIERKGRPNLTGKKALARINKDIESLYEYEKKHNPTTDKLTLFQQSFWSVHKDIKGSSSPYMKVLHNCLKTIDNQCIDESKEAYSSLLRAQLHPDELVFIFYNAIASDDFKDFKSRIEKYSILKDVANYNFPDELKDKYCQMAFKESN